MSLIKNDLFDNFMKNVVISDYCWLWTGRIYKDGYGGWTYDGIQLKPHRWSYRLYNGALIKGLVIAHKCDNKICVNPNHLEQVKQSKNIQDAYDRIPRKKGVRRELCYVSSFAARIRKKNQNRTKP